MDDTLFGKAMRAYRHYCDVSGQPFIPRSKQFSSVDGDIVYLVFSKRDYPVKYSITSDAIVRTA